jgi:hypothetical protein
MTQPVSGDRHSGWESVLREDIVLLNAAAAGSGWTVLEESHRKDAGSSWWDSLAAGASRLARGALERLGSWRTRASGSEEMGVTVVQAETIDAERASHFLMEDELVGPVVRRSVQQLQAHLRHRVAALAADLLAENRMRAAYELELADAVDLEEALMVGRDWGAVRARFLTEHFEQLRRGQELLRGWMALAGSSLSVRDRTTTQRRLEKMAKEHEQLQDLLQREASVDWQQRLSAVQIVIRDIRDRLFMLPMQQNINGGNSGVEIGRKITALLANLLFPHSSQQAPLEPATDYPRVREIAQDVRSQLMQLRSVDGVRLQDSAQQAILLLAAHKLQGGV